MKLPFVIPGAKLRAIATGRLKDNYGLNHHQFALSTSVFTTLSMFGGKYSKLIKHTHRRNAEVIYCLCQDPNKLWLLNKLDRI